MTMPKANELEKATDHPFSEKLLGGLLLVSAHIIAFALCHSPGGDLVASLFCTALTGWIVFAGLVFAFYLLIPLAAIAAGLTASIGRVLRTLTPTAR